MSGATTVFRAAIKLGKPARDHGVSQRNAATIGSRSPCAVSGERSRIGGFIRIADAAHVRATTNDARIARRWPRSVRPPSRCDVTMSASPASVVTAPIVLRTVIGSPSKTAANPAAMSG